MPALGLLLGIIQGLLEWLPVSSSGQITLFLTQFLGKSTEEALNMSIWLHAGTVCSAGYYYRKDLGKLLGSLGEWKKDNENGKMIRFLAVSTIMSGLVGAPLYFILKGVEYNGSVLIALVGVFLLFSGVLQKVGTGRKLKGPGQLKRKDSIMIGLAQGLSVIPGVSRSGMTVSLLLLNDFKSESALRLSFLMSIPLIIGAELGLGLLGGIEYSIGSLVGAVTAFIVGVFSIDFLVKTAKSAPFWKFCIGMGCLCIIAVFF